MIYGSLDSSIKYHVTVIERKSFLCIHELESKCHPQVGMAEERHVARVMWLNLISAMKAQGDC